MRSILRLGYTTLPLAFVSNFLLSRITAAKDLEPLVTFLLSGIAVIPLAQLMGESMAQLAERTGPTIGGLLNATFGNAAELIIGFIAMCARGLDDGKRSVADLPLVKRPERHVRPPPVVLDERKFLDPDLNDSRAGGLVTGSV